MKLISIKKTDNKTYSIDGNSYFIAGLFVFVFIFVLGSFLSWNFCYGLTLALIVVIFSLPIVFINDFFGKKKHKSIHKSALFQDIYKQGFKVEEYGKYHGLIKLKENRSLRIYYDWNKYAKGFFSFGDIVVNVFYKPLVNDYEGFEIKESQIDHLNLKYGKKNGYGYKQVFLVDRVVLHLNYYPWTKFEGIKKKFDESYKILNKEYLQPFNIEKKDEFLTEYAESRMYLPNMELIWEELEKELT